MRPVLKVPIVLRDLTELTGDLAEPFHSNARNLNLGGQRSKEEGKHTKKWSQFLHILQKAKTKQKKWTQSTQI